MIRAADAYDFLYGVLGKIPDLSRLAVCTRRRPDLSILGHRWAGDGSSDARWHTTIKSETILVPREQLHTRMQNFDLELG